MVSQVSQENKKTPVKVRFRENVAEKHCEKSGSKTGPEMYPKKFEYKKPASDESDRNEEWRRYFDDPKNGWPKGYVEDERKAIEEFGGG